MQHGQTPKQGHQQKSDTAWTDIPQNWAISKKRERRREGDGYEKQSKTLGFLDFKYEFQFFLLQVTFKKMFISKVF